MQSDEKKAEGAALRVIRRLFRSRLFIIFSIIALIEIGLRIFGYGAFSMRQIAGGHGLTEDSARQLLAMMEPTEGLFYRYRPDYHAVLKLKSGSGSDIDESFTVDLNSLGLRGELPPVARTPGSYRIVCIGDSNTFGFRVEADQAYCARLGNIVQKSNPALKVEVINGGMPGYDAHRSMIFFRRYLLEYRPDLVVLGFGPFNNGNVVIRDAAELCETNSPELLALRGMTSSLLLTRLAFSAAATVYANVVPPLEPVFKSTVSIDRLYSVYREYYALGRLYGFDMVVANIYYPHRRRPEFKPEYLYQDQLAEALLRLGERYAIPVLFFEKIFSPNFKKRGLPARPPSSVSLTTDGVHPNPYGHSIIATAIAFEISPKPYAAKPDDAGARTDIDLNLKLDEIDLGAGWCSTRSSERFIEFADDGRTMIFEKNGPVFYSAINDKRPIFSEAATACAAETLSLVGPRLITQTSLGRLELYPAPPRFPYQPYPFEGLVLDKSGSIMAVAGRLGSSRRDIDVVKRKVQAFRDSLASEPQYEQFTNMKTCPDRSKPNSCADEVEIYRTDIGKTEKQLIYVDRKTPVGEYPPDGEFQAAFYRLLNTELIGSECRPH